MTGQNRAAGAVDAVGPGWIASRLVMLLIKAYQWLVSPFLGPRCRFEPSCSAYAVEALAAHGVVRGLWLSVRRVGRCHPFHPGGYDPVPSPSRATHQAALAGREQADESVRELAGA